MQIYSNMWYCDLLGIQFLEKYPKDFINWIDEPDTWAETISRKMKVKNIIQLFDLWVNEKY